MAVPCAFAQNQNLIHCVPVAAWEKTEYVEPLPFDDGDDDWSIHVTGRRGSAQADFGDSWMEEKQYRNSRTREYEEIWVYEGDRVDHLEGAATLESSASVQVGASGPIRENYAALQIVGFLTYVSRTDNGSKKKIVRLDGSAAEVREGMLQPFTFYPPEYPPFDSNIDHAAGVYGDGDGPFTVLEGECTNSFEFTATCAVGLEFRYLRIGGRAEAIGQGLLTATGTIRLSDLPPQDCGS